jgi:hypothetical protein
MKTTIEISDALLQRARTVAAREKTTVRALVESGLRREIELRRQPAEFRLRDASFKGEGLQPGVPSDWNGLRDLAYEGRGA